MKQFIIAIGLLIGLLAGSIASAETNENENSLLWKIEGNGIQTSYLYGTFHLIPESEFHLSEAVKNAFKTSNQIIMELDMDNPQVQMGIMQHMGMKEGNSLKSMLKETTYVKLDSILKATMGMGMAAFDKVKPFMVASMLIPTIIEGKIASYEGTFIQMAKEQEKEILGLETVADQMSIFDKIPYEQQAEELAEMVDDKEKAIAIFNQMIDLYKAQDMNGLYNLFMKYYETEEEVDLMLNNRNANWIEPITELTTNKSSFIAVGAGHLGGDKGVVQLLKNKGFKVTPVN
ncbi:MAG: TraB/GumN family protein [Salinivirgaceae bacterium]|nr:MAG: TraB/GumN family protein [Salinivirgaceae bacterium]